jgi:hypothetical protein
MLITLLLLACAASPAAQTVAQARPVPVAITGNGLRVECLETKRGDRIIRTPFGLVSVPLDPVVEVTDGGAQLAQLLALREAGTLDDLSLMQDLSTAGQLTALALQCAAFAASDPESLEPYLLLEAWGVRLDPVARDLPREQRVEWLWERVQDDAWAKSVLAAARLREEVSQAFQAPTEQIVGIADLRKSLRRATPQHRRAAALIAGRQQEFSLREQLLIVSLNGTGQPTRDAAAWASDEIHPHAARNYWARNLARGEDPYRERAALALGRHAGADGVKVLEHVLAAHDHKVAERFTFAGREIWVVGDADRYVREVAGFDSQRQNVDVRHLRTDREYVDLGSTFKVTRYGERLAAALLAALDYWAGEKTGRDADQWLAWYLEDRAGNPLR